MTDLHAAAHLDTLQTSGDTTIVQVRKIKVPRAFSCSDTNIVRFVA
jgi:hypothetical protein